MECFPETSMDTEKIKLVDCHLHLQDEVLLRDAEAVVRRARSAGIERLVCNGSCPADWSAVLELAGRFEEIVPFLGVHPWWIGQCEENWLEELTTLAGQLSRVASQATALKKVEMRIHSIISS